MPPFVVVHRTKAVCFFRRQFKYSAELYPGLVRSLRQRRGLIAVGVRRHELFVGVAEVSINGDALRNEDTARA
jgi:hypothetical protein